MPFAYSGICLLAAAIALGTTSLARVLAVLLWPPVAPLVVASSLLGLGLAGGLLSLRVRAGAPAPSEPPESTLRRLAPLSIAHGLSQIAAFGAIPRISPDLLSLLDGGTAVLGLLMLEAIAALPLLCAGLAIGTALSRWVEHGSRLCAALLGGAALGILASVPLLGLLGGVPGGVAAGAGGLLAGSIFALGTGRGRAIATLAAIALAGVAGVGLATGTFAWPVPFAPGKRFARIEGEVIRAPGAAAEIELGPVVRLPRAAGGDVGRLGRGESAGRWIGRDGTAAAVLLADAPRIAEPSFLDDTRAAVPYVAWAARGREAPVVWVVGAGGGLEVLVALAHGAASVTVTEPDRRAIEAVTGRLDGDPGGLFAGLGDAGDRVRLLRDGGRSFARTSDRRYDLIELSHRASPTALAKGAYTVAPSPLHTREAVRDLYQRLEEDGLLVYTHPLLARPRQPHPSLRLANVARAALEELGIADPTRHLLVFMAHDRASVLVGRSPFDRRSVEALERFAARQGFWGIVFDPLDRPHALRHPGVPYEEAGLRALERAVLRGRVFGEDERRPLESLLEQLQAAYRLGLAGDDRAVGRTMRAVTAPIEDASTALAVRRLVRTRVEEGLAAEQAFQEMRDDFDSLLRGSWRERKEFRRGYRHDVSPTHDDSPFFFDGFRHQRLFTRSSPRPLSVYWSEYPVAHALLLGSLLQIAGLSALAIGWPLRRLRRAGVATRARLRLLGCFGALGASSAALGLVGTQRIGLLLGSPTEALLWGVVPGLAAAALGALGSARGPLPRRRGLALLGLACVATVAAWAWLVPPLLDLAGAWPFVARAALAVALVSPPGLALGASFPAGLRVVAAESPGLLPLAFAAHAMLGVLGFVGGLAIAMAAGFPELLGLATALLGLGFLGPAARRRRAAAAD